MGGGEGDYFRVRKESNINYNRGWADRIDREFLALEHIVI